MRPEYQYSLLFPKEKKAAVKSPVPLKKVAAVNADEWEPRQCLSGAKKRIPFATGCPFE